MNIVANVTFINYLKHPVKMKKAQSEIDRVLGQGKTTFESLKKLE